VTGDLGALLATIRACRLCRDAPFAGPPLPHEPRPVFQIGAAAPILIAGQAPGTRVHRSGRPFTDPSGDRLRAWMGIDATKFYDPRLVAIVPMGFCFPGLSAAGADLPPRRECVRTWHDRLFDLLPPPRLLLAVGAPAQRFHLVRLGRRGRLGRSLTETVSRWREIRGGDTAIFPLPHPSWRNSAWLKRHPWFERELLPELRAAVAGALADVE
jgi:uracil-DNA glycosylase